MISYFRSFPNFTYLSFSALLFRLPFLSFVPSFFSFILIIFSCTKNQRRSSFIRYVYILSPLCKLKHSNFYLLLFDESSLTHTWCGFMCTYIRYIITHIYTDICDLGSQSLSHLLCLHVTVPRFTHSLCISLRSLVKVIRSHFFSPFNLLCPLR